MELDDALKGRYSVRRFKDEPIPKKDLETIIDAGRYAPSSSNTQPWHYIVITNKDKRKELQSLVDKAYDKAMRDAEKFDHKGSVSRIRLFSRYAKLRDAPAYVIVLTEPYSHEAFKSPWERYRHSRMSRVMDETVLKSTMMSVQNCLLKAYELGYGSCVLDGPLIAEPKMRELFDYDPKYSIGIIMVLGKEEGKGKSPGRKELKDITTFYE